MEKTKEERIKKIAQMYYSRKDLRKNIFDFSKNREIAPRYFDRFGKRPDILHYDSDIFEFAKKGWVSFHCSEELWSDPLQLSTELSEEQLNELRIGWDLLLDIDSRYLDYSKVYAELLIKALEFNGVENIGVKFSGKKGFHIIVPWNAFPEQIYGIQTKDKFPEWPRIICKYLNESIKKQLIEKISDLQYKNRRVYVKDFEAPKEVIPDLILVSIRHFFRMPYSLHEGTGLSSVVLDKSKISEFQIHDADPFKIKIFNFYPSAKKDEAEELLLQALDWEKSQQKPQNKKPSAEFKEITIKNLTPNLYPPCVINILKGLEKDGRKRALFILINFFKSLKLSDEEIESKIEQWNKKNKKPLNSGYINSQLKWFKGRKPMLPPNCDKEHYKASSSCIPDQLCKLIKNPVNYSIKKMFLLKKRKNGNKNN